MIRPFIMSEAEAGVSETLTSVTEIILVPWMTCKRRHSLESARRRTCTACRCEYVLKWHFLACPEGWDIHFVSLRVDRMKEEAVSPLNGVVLERLRCFGKGAQRAVAGKVTIMAAHYRTAATIVSRHLHSNVQFDLGLNPELV